MTGTAISPADVARFVAEYMSGRGATSARRPAPTGNLLRDIAEAYLVERSLPASALTEVMALVDSVL